MRAKAAQLVPRAHARGSQAQYAAEHLAELTVAAAAVTPEQTRFHEAVLQAADVRPGARVLQVGCGCGTFTAALQVS